MAAFFFAQLSIQAIVNWHALGLYGVGGLFVGFLLLRFLVE